MILLDTHVWLWWIAQDTERLDPGLNEAIGCEDIVAVSTISCFEVAWLKCHGRIALPCEISDWFTAALGGSDVSLLQITPQIATRAAELPEYHSDPQDRLIIATGLSHKAKIASRDRNFRLYEEISDLLL